MSLSRVTSRSPLRALVVALLMLCGVMVGAGSASAESPFSLPSQITDHNNSGRVQQQLRQHRPGQSAVGRLSTAVGGVHRQLRRHRRHDLGQSDLHQIRPRFQHHPFGRGHQGPIIRDQGLVHLPTQYDQAVGRYAAGHHPAAQQSRLGGSGGRRGRRLSDRHRQRRHPDHQRGPERRPARRRAAARPASPWILWVHPAGTDRRRG